MVDKELADEAAKRWPEMEVENQKWSSGGQRDQSLEQGGRVESQWAWRRVKAEGSLGGSGMPWLMPVKVVLWVRETVPRRWVLRYGRS